MSLLDDMLALLPDNTSGEISAEDMRTIVTDLWNQLELKATLASPTFTGTVSGITKAMVGLDSVDNTADSAKPVSTAQQTALNFKAPIASPTFTGTVSGITKSMVGLGSVDNTADMAKPVSTAQQTALDLKADIASPTFTGTVSGITATMVGAQPVDSDLTTIAGLTATTDSFMQAKGSAWSACTVAQVLVDLAVPGTTFQPIDADLTTIAGLTATTDNFIQSKSSTWASRTPAQVATDLQTAGLAPKASPTFTGTVSAATITATARIQPGFFTLTDGATVAVDASLGNTAVLVITGDHTLGTPSNGATHQRLMVVVAQDGSGSHLMTLSSGIKDPNSFYTGLSTGANKISYLGIAFDGVNWNVLAYAKGYN